MGIQMNENADTSASRMAYLDWMRVLAILVVFFFHAARPFDHDGWHIKNGEISEAFSVFIFFIAQFIMPLFFFMSGISSLYALKHGPRAYIKSRVKRLLVPLLFGIFVVIAPIQVWIERMDNGQFAGSFIEFYPRYFDGFYGFGGNFAWMGIHLWYLEMLFLFSLITLPFFIWMKRKAGIGMGKKSGFTENALSPLIFIIPLIIVELLANLDPHMIGRRDWGGWNLFSHLIFFPAGFLCALYPGFIGSMKRGRFLYLAAAVPFTICGLFIHNDPGSPVSNYIMFCFWHSIVPWLWIFFIVGIAKTYLTAGNTFLRYASDAVLPFYILHQTVIVVAFFFMKQWDWPIWAKYMMLCPISFAVIMVVYEFVVRRYSPMRFFFGMK